MVAQKGKDLLLKIDSDGLGSFVTVAGLRSKRIAFNSETVDITDADSAGRWRELLAGSGVQRAAISGSGIFKDAQSDATIRSRFFAGEISDWQLAVPNFGTVEGPFQITSLDYTGSHDGEVTFEIALELAGPITSRWRHDGEPAARRDRGRTRRQAVPALPDARRAGRTGSGLCGRRSRRAGGAVFARPTVGARHDPDHRRRASRRGQRHCR